MLIILTHVSSKILEKLVSVLEFKYISIPKYVKWHFPSKLRVIVNWMISINEFENRQGNEWNIRQWFYAKHNLYDRLNNKLTLLKGSWYVFLYDVICIPVNEFRGMFVNFRRTNALSINFFLRWYFTCICINHCHCKHNCDNKYNNNNSL